MQHPSETARLAFRLWREDDGPLAQQLWGDPAVTAHLVAGGRLSAQAVQARLREERERQASVGVSYWPVFERASGELVGCCGLRPRPAADELELGFHLRPAFWGRGLATEAARAAIAFAFARLAVRALFAGHHPENAASRRTLLKLGFVDVGDELYPPTGLRHPAYRLGRQKSG